MKFEITHHLGRYSQGWHCHRGKALLREVDRRSTTGDEELLGLSGSKGVLRKSDIAQRSAEAASHIGYKLVSEGNLVCNKMQAWNGVFGISPYDGITSPDYATYEFHGDCAPRLIEYMVKTALFSADFLSRSNGIGTGYMRLNPADFLATHFWLPSRDHQEQIVRFLDRETTCIAGLIEKKTRFITLLNEKEKSAISQLVREGLDKGADCAGSGVEWRGNVPVHWRRARLKDYFRQEKRQGYEDLTVLSVYREFGVVEKSSRDDNINKTPEDLTKYQLVNPNDLVINKMKAWQGSMGISQIRGITSPDYVVMRPIRVHDPRYMHHYLRAQPMPWVYHLISNGIRTDQWRMEPEKFLGLPIFMPPIEEQRRIADQIDVELERIRRLIALTQRSIELLKEKRAALITAAVTGKIDVRDAA